MQAYLITGSSSGIGAELARNLAAPDVSLVLHARHAEDRLNNVIAEVRAKGAACTSVMGDFATDDTLAAQLVDAAINEFGRLDAVIANAGFPLMKSFADGGPDDIDYAFKGNLYSFFALAKAAHPHLKSAANPRIVAVGSFTAYLFRTDMPQFPMSAASKGGLETAVRSVAAAMAADGITVNCVVPGYIEKDPGTSDGLPLEKLRELEAMIPLQRLGKPHDVAATIRFLLSADAGYITGQAIHVNGGLV